jgi:hypothetical protein
MRVRRKAYFFTADNRRFRVRSYRRRGKTSEIPYSPAPGIESIDTYQHDFPTRLERAQHGSPRLRQPINLT